MQNIVPKRLYNAVTFTQLFPFATIFFFSNIPLQVRVDNSLLNARERVDIAIVRFYTAPKFDNFGILAFCRSFCYIPICVRVVRETAAVRLARSILKKLLLNENA